MWKHASDLLVGDVWTERPQGRATRSYRVIAIAPGLAPTTMRVTRECVTTGQRRTTYLFLVNRVEVHEDRSSGHAETSATAVDQPNTPADAAAQQPNSLDCAPCGPTRATAITPSRQRGIGGSEPSAAPHQGLVAPVGQ
jgi:hypothetical protein